METGKIFPQSWQPAVGYLLDKLNSGDPIFSDDELSEVVPDHRLRIAILAEMEERGAVSKEFPRATYFEISGILGGEPIRVPKVDKAIIETLGFQDRKVLPAIREIAAQVAPGSDDNEHPWTPKQEEDGAEILRKTRDMKVKHFCREMELSDKIGGQLFHHISGTTARKRSRQ